LLRAGKNTSITASRFNLGPQSALNARQRSSHNRRNLAFYLQASACFKVDRTAPADDLAG
jgi:hypothetical protein